MLVDWVAAFEPLVARGNWHWGMDGKVRMNFTALQSETPWLQSGPLVQGDEEPLFDCAMLHIVFTHVFKQRAVPTFCHNCYKVVIVPTDLDQVEKIGEWQRSTCEDNGWPCKTGAEVRPYVKRKWGAYFYCRGLEEGRERYKAVRKWVDDNLGEDVDVFLKRGCTEFEIALGDSDKWEMIDRQDEVEEEARKVIDYKPERSLQDVVDTHTYQNWNEWEGKTRVPITYHEEGE